MSTLTFSAFDVNRDGANPHECSSFLEIVKQQATTSQGKLCEIPLSDGTRRKIFFHNTRVAEILSGGLTPDAFEQLETYLKAWGTFDIRVEKNGSVVAAAIPTDRGEYGRAVWSRDIARIFEGLVALDRRDEARQVALATIKILSTDEQLQRLVENIQDPSVHHGVDAKMRVPHIRVNAENFESFSEVWNHKQNDALALSYLVFLRALDEGLIDLETLDSATLKFALLLPVYFDRVEYWKMYDSGAWEEWEALRTSSVGLVAAVFDRLRDRVSEPPFQKLLSNRRLYKELSEELAHFVSLTWRLGRIESLYQEGLKLVRDQLPRGEAPEFVLEEEARRSEDAALAHLLWYPLRDFQEADYAQIFAQLSKLTRTSGIPRYRSDVYMAGLYYFQVPGSDLPVPEELLLEGQTLTLGDLAKMFRPRSPARLQEFFGAELEPQWGIADPILAVAHLRRFRQTGDSQHFAEYEFHALRTWGMLTPEIQGAGPYAADGRRVAPAVMPEAYVPIVLRGRQEPVWLPSRNTPLNWITSELAILWGQVN